MVYLALRKISCSRLLAVPRCAVSRLLFDIERTPERASVVNIAMDTFEGEIRISGEKKNIYIYIYIYTFTHDHARARTDTRVTYSRAKLAVAAMNRRYRKYFSTAYPLSVESPFVADPIGRV